MPSNHKSCRGEVSLVLPFSEIFLQISDTSFFSCGNIIFPVICCQVDQLHNGKSRWGEVSLVCLPLILNLQLVVSKIQKIPNWTLPVYHHFPWAKEKQFSVFPLLALPLNSSSGCTEVGPEVEARTSISALALPLPSKRPPYGPRISHAPLIDRRCSLDRPLFREALGHTRASFLKWRKLFHSLCSLWKLHKSTPHSHMIFFGGSGCPKRAWLLHAMSGGSWDRARARPIFIQAPQAPKIAWKKGILLRIVVRCWWILV